MSNYIPRVSIGLPVFNAERFLEQALDSILTQTYTDFELIISDNASTDRTPAICQTYAARDRRIRFYRNSENLGAAPNFNRVFELSSGEYFKWAAYDDLIAPNFLSRCVNILDQNPNVILAYTKARLIDEHSVILEEQKYSSDTGSSQPHLRFRNLTLNRVDTAIPVWGVMRTDIVRHSGLIAGYPSSDLVFLAELALYGQFHEIDESLFFWRYHPEQSTKGELSVERDRILWFDTSARGKLSLPKWLLLLGYLRAISSASLNFYQRTYCYMQMLRWVFVPAHFRALGKDLLLAAYQIMTRAVLATCRKPMPNS